MKKALCVFVAIILCISIAGCSTASSASNAVLLQAPIPDTGDGRADNTEDDKVIRIFCYTGEVVELIKKFQELHPDFGYEIEIYNEYMFGDEYDTGQKIHDIMSGYLDVVPPDIYSMQMEDIYMFAKGSDSKYVIPYEELGLDVDRLLKEAKIPQYMIDAGTNREGKLVALGYESTSGAFIYRRSIAKKVWGTDDPSVISGKIGPGWDRFLEAAAELKANGYSICSGIRDIWLPIDRNAQQGWFEDGQLVISPERAKFFDIAREMFENGYTNNTEWWTEEWFAGIRGEGEKEVFGYFEPYWFVKYEIEPYCSGEKVGEGTYGDWAVCDPPVGFFNGGTMFVAGRNTRHKEAVGEIIRWLTLDTSETGCQYLLATGKIFDDDFRFPASEAVAGKVECKPDVLGGQDLFEAYLSANRLARGKGLSEHGKHFSVYWADEALEYAEGRKTREQAIADFRKNVDDYLSYWTRAEEEKEKRKSGIKEEDDKNYKGVIRVYSDSGELRDVLDKFLELHPDFGYKIEYIPSYSYPVELLPKLLDGELDGYPPDIYGIQTYYANTFTKESPYRHALPYQELGIDVEKIINDSAIPQYIVVSGMSPEGQIVALGYNSAVGAFIYRRSIARKVWGTDDPARIGSIIGPGWDKFFSAAADLAKKGYAICSDIYDIWNPYEACLKQGWVKDGRLVIDKEREAFLDYARRLVKNGYTSNAQWWTQEWYEQISNKGQKEVFGYMGPYWLASTILMPSSDKSTTGDWAICDPPQPYYWGDSLVFVNRDAKYKDAIAEIIRWMFDASEAGCQFLIAKGEILNGTSLPASTSVMEKLTLTPDFFGGQNVFRAFLSAGRNANARLWDYGGTIDNLWLDEVRAYAEGTKTREKALSDFKNNVAQQLGISVDR